jgi:hypothetical protein
MEWKEINGSLVSFSFVAAGMDWPVARAKNFQGCFV